MPWPVPPAVGLAALQARHKADVVKVAVLVMTTPFLVLKLSKEYCLKNTWVPEGYPCVGTDAERIWFVLRNFWAVYVHMVLPQGNGSLWATVHVWIEILTLAVMVWIPADLYHRAVLPLYAGIVHGVGPVVMHVSFAMVLGTEPTALAWEHLCQAPLYRLTCTLLFPSSPKLEVAATLATSALTLAACTLLTRVHPSLQLDISKQLLLTCAATAAVLMIQLLSLHLRARGASRVAAGRALPAPPAGSETSGACKAGCSKPSPSAAPCMTNADDAVDTDAAAACTPDKPVQPQPSSERLADALPRAPPVPIMLAVASLRHRPYMRVLQQRTLHIKLEGVEPEHLIEGWEQRLVELTTGHAGGNISSLCMRSGCVEIVADVLAPVGLPLSLLPDSDASVFLELLRPGVVPCGITASLVQAAEVEGAAISDGRSFGMGMPELWSRAGSSSSSSLSAGSSWSANVSSPGTRQTLQDILPPSIRRVQPRVLAAQGPGVSAVLAVTLAWPAGGAGAQPVELVARNRHAYMATTCTSSSAAAAHEPIPLHVPSLPAGQFMLMVECLVPELGSYSQPAAVVVLDNAAAAEELQQVFSGWLGPMDEMEGLLLDLGSWVEHVGQAKAGNAGGAAVHGWAALELGAHLLQYACLCGWPHTARWLMHDLRVLSVPLRELSPGRLLTRGSPSLIACALEGRSLQCLALVLGWQVRQLLALLTTRPPDGDK